MRCIYTEVLYEDPDVQFFFRVFDHLLCLRAQDPVADLLAEVIHDVCQLRLLGHAGYLAGTAAVLRLLLRVQVRAAPLHGGEVHLADAPAPYTWPPSIVHARGRTSWWLHPDPAWSEITELVITLLLDAGDLVRLMTSSCCVCMLGVGRRFHL